METSHVQTQNDSEGFFLLAPFYLPKMFRFSDCSPWSEPPCSAMAELPG
jgi:hypothetical protein